MHGRIFPCDNIGEAQPYTEHSHHQYHQYYCESQVGNHHDLRILRNRQGLKIVARRE